MIAAPGVDLKAAAAELAKIAEAYDGAVREGCGVLILRSHTGQLLALGVSEDVAPGMVDEIILPPAPPALVALRLTS